MKETVPIARYIARIHGYYPTSAIDAFQCDYLIQIYQPVINKMDSSVFMIGSKKKAHEKMVCEELLPNFFKKIEEQCKNGWLIGDG